MFASWSRGFVTALFSTYVKDLWQVFVFEVVWSMSVFSLSLGRNISKLVILGNWPLAVLVIGYFLFNVYTPVVSVSQLVNYLQLTFVILKCVHRIEIGELHMIIFFMINEIRCWLTGGVCVSFRWNDMAAGRKALLLKCFFISLASFSLSSLRFYAVYKTCSTVTAAGLLTQI